MTSRHARLIAVTVVLGIRVLSTPLYAQQEALADLRARAEQGQPRAQFELGLLYEKGLGIHQDDAQAIKWYRRVRTSWSLWPSPASAGWPLKS